MNNRKRKNIFTQGAISPVFIGESIAKHSSQKNIGAHSLFLGQVRSDIIDGKTVTAIDYTTYEEMALEKMHQLREDLFTKYALTCMHIHHSLGLVAAGNISLFVFTSAPQRRVAIDACAAIVEQIKAELPVWGKEIFDDESYQWKTNTAI